MYADSARARRLNGLSRAARERHPRWIADDHIEAARPRRELLEVDAHAQPSQAPAAGVHSASPSRSRAPACCHVTSGVSASNHSDASHRNRQGAHVDSEQLVLDDRASERPERLATCRPAWSKKARRRARVQNLQRPGGDEAGAMISLSASNARSHTRRAKSWGV